MDADRRAGPGINVAISMAEGDVRPADKADRLVPLMNDKGFTLIELLIVVTIVSIVTAIAAPGLLRARMTANEASAIASM